MLNMHHPRVDTLKYPASLFDSAPGRFDPNPIIILNTRIRCRLRVDLHDGVGMHAAHGFNLSIGKFVGPD